MVTGCYINRVQRGERAARLPGRRQHRLEATSRATHGRLLLLLGVSQCTSLGVCDVMSPAFHMVKRNDVTCTSQTGILLL